jgi:membrane-associated phospholipid phosphatase
MRTRARTACLGVALGVQLLAGAARAEEGESPRLGEGKHFIVDPVVDGVLISGGVAFSGLLSLVLSTGEIRPSLPGSSSQLLAIDRVAVTQSIDPNAGLKSDFGLWTAYGYAAVDSILTGARDGRYALLVDAVIYAESITLTRVFTYMTKVGVRRPRPIDYVKCESSPTGSCLSDTDLQLSFFSGHASVTGAVAATATYLAFVRHAHSPRPWLTLAAGLAVTSFVSYERVRSGAHFPTDVIMGSMAGAGIGVLVSHLHRRRHVQRDELGAESVWLGFAPAGQGGGLAALGGVF